MNTPQTEDEKRRIIADIIRDRLPWQARASQDHEWAAPAPAGSIPITELYLNTPYPLDIRVAPAPPEPEWVELGPEDVPPGSAVLWQDERRGWCMITSCSPTGIRIWQNCRAEHEEIPWKRLMVQDCLILRPGGTWEPCRKAKV